MTTRVLGAVQGDVEEMPDIVEIPRDIGVQRRRALICGDRRFIISKERLAEAHERERHIVFGLNFENLPQMKRRLPRVAIDEELRQLTVKVEPLLRVAFACEESLKEHARLVKAFVGEGALSGRAEIADVSFPMLGHAVVLQGGAHLSNTHLVKCP